jgi:YVTN family beta-propeller protein
VTRSIAVGKEPRAIVLSPNNKSVYVANAVSNSITEIDPETLTVKRTVAIPEALGLQPRALAVTSDRDFDDADEKLYAAAASRRLARPHRASTRRRTTSARADRGLLDRGPLAADDDRARAARRHRIQLERIRCSTSWAP